MKVLIVAAALVSAVALSVQPNAAEAAPRSPAGQLLAPAAANDDLVLAAEAQAPATADEQTKGGKKGHKGNKNQSTGAPAAGAGAPPTAGGGKKTPSTPAAGAAAATGGSKKKPGAPGPGPAPAAVVNKPPGTPPAPAAAGTPALPPGVPAGATIVPATGGNPPSYIVPTPNGTQTYVQDPRTGQYVNPSAIPAQGNQ